MKARDCKVCGKEISILRDYCDKCKNLIEKNGNRPIYVCQPCGEQHGEKKDGKSYEQGCWFKGKCAVCNKQADVTHYRLYGYLTKGDNKKTINREGIFKKLKKSLTK